MKKSNAFLKFKDNVKALPFINRNLNQFYNRFYQN